jgi:NADH:ubiquinone reductase (non-electrogenic)
MHFINSDLAKIDPERARDCRVVVIEASQLLGSFDRRLRQYAANKLIKSGVTLRRGMVKEAFKDHVVLQSGDELPFGLCVWSTGVGPTEFTTSLPFARTPKGRLAVDEYQRVLVHPSVAARADGEHHPEKDPAPGPAAVSDVAVDQAEHGEDPEHLQRLAPIDHVFALGDCCARMDLALPALAQVAEQQGRYLARYLNAEARALEKGDNVEQEPFKYRQLGAMASVGGHSAVLELGEANREWFSLAGFWSWIAWRSAYLTRLGTVQNRLYVMINWTLALLFGRDVSRW